ncbi:beta-ketoacyl-[acyl-carrier-protein] synthase family protein [Nocardia sp. 2]|uniref:Beta-ketoacyl-[acyl-carrier-protein] synthase family protein n=1 Tax=Nocardia acididurans TaxID=2802282 RepID=A0ABS1M724_9NOCA|nr:beta-ketoacyl-[acyl-carrier-protein] synthase family protein [Nocardia acididurans]
MITGIGLVTALGEGVTATWDAIVDGRSGVAPLRSYDTAPLRTRIGAEIPDFDAARYMKARTIRMSTRGDQFGIAAAALALGDAGLDTDALGMRAGLYLGGNKDVCDLDPLIAGIVGIRNVDSASSIRLIGELAPSMIPPLIYVEGLQSAACFHISLMFGIRGPNAYYAGAADAGAMAIGRAMRAIRRGEADLAVAGGCDDATTWWAMSKMDGLGLLTRRNELGERACRPFDRDHDGAVLGEGGVVLVLEEREHALARGARCYAEITGVGSGNDSVRAPGCAADGRGLVRAIAQARTDAAALRDIDAVRGPFDRVLAHGSGTPSGDLSEMRALRTALGVEAEKLAVTSCKPQVGHLVGAAGAMNVAAAALSLYSGVVPSTLNHSTAAPGCDLDVVAGSARETPAGRALALARGVEGQAVAVGLAAAS